ncbi:MAG: hypothetical protein J6J24_03765 [Clostridia bacterium]|nr:hypothetical protein [Clostridia bacterium]
MKKLLYTILSVLSIIYVGFLIVNICRGNNEFGAFEKWFDLIVNFGGVAIIFCFALVNFAGSPLKIAFFIALIVAIVIYIIVLAAPEFFANLFGGGSAGNALNNLSVVIGR